MKKILFIILLIGAVSYGLYLKYLNYTESIENEIIQELDFIQSAQSHKIIKYYSSSKSKQKTILEDEILEKLENAASEYKYPITCLNEAESYRKLDKFILMERIKERSIEISDECKDGLREVFVDQEFIDDILNSCDWGNLNSFMNTVNSYLEYFKDSKIKSNSRKSDFNCKLNLISNFNKHIYLFNKNKKIIELVTNEIVEDIVNQLILSKNKVLGKFKNVKKGDTLYRLKVFAFKQINEKFPFVKGIVRDTVYSSLINKQDQFKVDKMEILLAEAKANIKKKLSKKKKD